MLFHVELTPPEEWEKPTRDILTEIEDTMSAENEWYHDEQDIMFLYIKDKLIWWPLTRREAVPYRRFYDTHY